MKRLLTLIILLISLNGFCQSPEYIKKDYEFWKRYLYGSDTLQGEELVKFKAKQNLLPILLQYQEFCKGDSTGYIGYYTLQSVNDSTDIAKPNYYYIQHQPSFNDFINWLKK